MKDRLIISVSDIKGTKSYNVHQFAKRFLLIIILIFFLILGGSFLFISYLDNKIDKIKVQKQKEIELLEQKESKIVHKLKEDLEVLTKKEKKLITQNDLYSEQIDKKVKEIDSLSSKLDEISAILGINDSDTSEEITQKTLKAINENKKKYTLLVIPNGKPVDKINITSPFGYRTHPITKKKQFHRAVDLAAPKKTPIYATADGIIEFVQANNRGDYGRLVKISHNYGFKTVFAHMYKTAVKVGDFVKKGDIIGYVGNSGRSTASHVHYEVRYVNKVLNPYYFIKWNLDNYNMIFKKIRRVQWESLINQINEELDQIKLQ